MREASVRGLLRLLEFTGYNGMDLYHLNDLVQLDLCLIIVDLFHQHGPVIITQIDLDNSVGYLIRKIRVIVFA